MFKLAGEKCEQMKDKSVNRWKRKVWTDEREKKRREGGEGGPEIIQMTRSEGQDRVKGER